MPAPAAEPRSDGRPKSGAGQQPGAGSDADAARRGGALATLDGARSEVRKQLREQQRLRMATLALAALLMLGALPLFFGIRAATRDPVFNSLDALPVPGWAAVEVQDASSGSRWCFIDCRFRERTVQSERSPDETAQVYQSALRDAGWQRWQVELCPEQPAEGHYTCWRRDEFTLDLWVRAPTCLADPLAQRPAVEPTDDPAVLDDACDGSTVSIKVRNAIADDRTRPQPAQDPGLTGEDPDPIVTDDPLLEATPSPS